MPCISTSTGVLQFPHHWTQEPRHCQRATACAAGMLFLLAVILGHPVGLDPASRFPIIRPRGFILSWRLTLQMMETALLDPRPKRTRRLRLPRSIDVRRKMCSRKQWLMRARMVTGLMSQRMRKQSCMLLWDAFCSLVPAHRTMPSALFHRRKSQRGNGCRCHTHRRSTLLACRSQRPWVPEKVIQAAQTSRTLRATSPEVALHRVHRILRTALSVQHLVRRLSLL
mmetsp:Transcript_38900/g.91621  ORF Transcript_38900/g.91621 Transcript_38900/m.91621 type:complete len:226 (-) Transcript_38900:480-1157(-)